MTDPADARRRHAGHQREIRHVLGHHRARGDEGVGTDGMAANDRRVRADGRAAADEGRAKRVLALDLGTRSVDVGEHAGRPAEHTLLERDALIEADVVLDLAGVADNDVGADHDVLPDGYVAPDPHAAEDVAEVPDLRAFADLDRPIDIDRLVDLHPRIGLRHAARGQGHDGGRWRLAALLHQLFARARQHPEHAQPLAAIGARPRAGAHAIEEVQALLPERLRRLERDRHRLRLRGHRHIVLPLDFVRIEQELSLPWLAIIEHRHPVGADNDEALLLIRVEPRYKDVRLLAARESQVRRRYVGDRPVQEIAADGLDLHRLGADERKDHRYVVWGEGPQDVLLAPDLSEVEAARVDILQPSEPALADEVAQLQERRVVLQDVPDHEAPVEPLGEGANLLRLLDLQRQRLLEEDVFAGRQGLLAERVVLRRRCCAS